jgi:hypothetical protein
VYVRGWQKVTKNNHAKQNKKENGIVGIPLHEYVQQTKKE